MFRSLPIGRVVLLCLFGVVIVLGATSSAPSVLGASGAVYQLIKPEVVHQGLTAEAWKNIQASIERDQYALQALGASYLAPNRGMKSRFSAEGFEVRPSTKNTSWTWSLMLTGYSYGERIQPVSPVQPYVDQNRIEYRRGNLVEQYVNDHRGVHQGFTIAVAPTMRSTRSLLEVHLATQGNLKPALGQDRTGITWVNDSGSAVLNYSGLRAWDVQGKTLRAQMALTANGIVLIVEDSLAQYPVTIDSFTQLAKLTASDGSQSDSFGTTVAIDSNTILVGATGAKIGAAYVYGK